MPIEFLVYGFRYALGRRSAGVSQVAETLRRHAADLGPHARTQIVADIDHAIDGGFAGADCDVADWREVARVMRATDDNEENR